MKKKLLLMLTLAASCVFACFGITACSGEPQHEHSFTEEVTNEEYLKSQATCKDKAVYYKSCSCGEKGTETFEYGNLAEHSYGTWIAEKPASETDTGVKGHYHCSGCEKNFDDNHNVIESITIPKKEHTHAYTQTITTDKYLASDATCTKKATYYKSCSCGEKGTETFEYGNALGHNYGTLIDEAPATCSATGLAAHYYCSACKTYFDSSKQKTTLEDLTIAIDEDNHDYKDGVCSACGGLKVSEGLAYTLLSDGTFTVSGIGTCKDENIVIPSVYNDVKVTSIRQYAFQGCSITGVVIPGSVTSIEKYAFTICTNLTSATIGNGVKNMDEGVFDGCSSLVSVIIPDSVTAIPNYMFHSCSSLTSVTIPDGITSIGDSAFSGCSSLTGLTIENSVTSIASGAFNGCTALTYNEYGNAHYLGNSENMYLWLIEAKSTDITSCTINAACKYIVLFKTWRHWN